MQIQNLYLVHTPYIQKGPPNRILQLFIPTLSRTQRLLPHRLSENLQRHRRLVIRHLMPCSKNPSRNVSFGSHFSDKFVMLPQKAKIVHRLERSPLRAINRIRVQRCGIESGRAGVGDGVGGGKTAKPVADPVGVAGPDDDLDAGLDYGGELGEEGAGVCWGQRRVSAGFREGEGERAYRRLWKRTSRRVRRDIQCRWLWHQLHW